MKFLFNDSSGKIRQMSSKEELDYHISISPEKHKVKIWLYHSSSWVSYQEYVKSSIVNRETVNGKGETEKPVQATVTVKTFTPAPPPIVKERKPRPPTVTKPLQILLNICIVMVVAGGVYAALFYNKREWTEPKSFETITIRPPNAQSVNTDSVIHTIEVKEMRTLDKLTKMNLRLRNNWADKIVLTLQGQQEIHLKKDSILRFTKLQCIVKNFSGYEIDQAVVSINVWKDGVVKTQDTFRLQQIGYRGEPYTQTISNTYKGDSLTIHFQSVRSFGLNFCYSYEEPTISGNPNDKWFCKD